MMYCREIRNVGHQNVNYIVNNGEIQLLSLNMRWFHSANANNALWETRIALSAALIAWE